VLRVWESWVPGFGAPAWVWVQGRSLSSRLGPGERARVWESWLRELEEASGAHCSAESQV
jgi:hypothetical protein